MNNKFIFAQADDVAKAGYKGMLKGKREVIPGFSNKIGATTSELLPKKLTTKISGVIFDRVLK